jgi:hypothetical protein
MSMAARGTPLLSSSSLSGPYRVSTSLAAPSNASICSAFHLPLLASTNTPALSPPLNPAFAPSSVSPVHSNTFQARSNNFLHVHDLLSSQKSGSYASIFPNLSLPHLCVHDHDIHRNHLSHSHVPGPPTSSAHIQTSLGSISELFTPIAPLSTFEPLLQAHPLDTNTQHTRLCILSTALHKELITSWNPPYNHLVTLVAQLEAESVRLRYKQQSPYYVMDIDVARREALSLEQSTPMASWMPLDTAPPLLPPPTCSASVSYWTKEEFEDLHGPSQNGRAYFEELNGDIMTRA